MRRQDDRASTFHSITQRSAVPHLQNSRSTHQVYKRKCVARLRGRKHATYSPQGRTSQDVGSRQFTRSSVEHPC